MSKFKSIQFLGFQLWKMAVGVAVILGIAVVIGFLSAKEKPNSPEVNTLSSLEKVVKTSELSTYTAVYNGIAEIMNEQKPEDVDCYVSYNAKVNAGIDLKNVKISLDGKIITIEIPKIYITDTIVDESSIDIIYYNDKRNQMGITEIALAACKNDVKQESESETAIFDLAKQNAKNILTALTMPFIEQLGKDYSLNITYGGN